MSGKEKGEKKARLPLAGNSQIGDLITAKIDLRSPGWRLRWTRREGGRGEARASTPTRPEPETRAHAGTSARADAPRGFPGTGLPACAASPQLSLSPALPPGGTQRKVPAGSAGRAALLGPFWRTFSRRRQGLLGDAGALRCALEETGGG